MQEDLQLTPTRRALRARRTRRRLVPLVSVAAAAGILATTGFVVASPDVAAAVEPALSPAAAATVAADSLMAPTVDEATSKARVALAEARVALASADEVTTAVTDSGLELDTETTTIDTRELHGAVDRVEELDVIALVLTPEATDDVAAAAETVASRAADVRADLNAALAQRAEETAAAVAAAEAAAQAQREAEAAAAAAAAAAANTPDGAKATARRMAAEKFGWGDGQFSCLESLWTKESGWDYQAYNPSSGATGIPQSLPGNKMATAGADWQTNATTQITWGLDYIARAYGTPCSAWGHSQATNWY